MKLVDVLSTLKLNHVTDVQGTKIVARRPRAYSSANDPGCKDCVFQKEGGAAECSFKNSCMAHKRPDRKSVIFKILKTKKNGYER